MANNSILANGNNAPNNVKNLITRIKTDYIRNKTISYGKLKALKNRNKTMMTKNEIITYIMLQYYYGWQLITTSYNNNSGIGYNGKTLVRNVNRFIGNIYKGNNKSLPFVFPAQMWTKLKTRSLDELVNIAKNLSGNRGSVRGQTSGSTGY